MYNRLLFYCSQLPSDVIFAAVSNQCPHEAVVRETLPTLKVAVERLTYALRGEAFLRKLRTANFGYFEEELSFLAIGTPAPFAVSCQ